MAVFVWTLRIPPTNPWISLLLSWRNTTGWFTNTDASARCTGDDGSPEHNYAPAIGKTDGQRNRWIENRNLKGVVLEGNVSNPVAEGEGQWCIATSEQPGVTIQRCSRWNPPAMAVSCGTASALMARFLRAITTAAVVPMIRSVRRCRCNAS